VTLRGERKAIILSAETYDALMAQRSSLVDHLISGPAWPDDLVAAIDTRSKIPSRRSPV